MPPGTAGTIIRYRRPEAPWSVATMVISGDEELVKVQIDRLLALGYSIVDSGQSPSPALVSKAL
jgi:hypothetical protein